MTDTTTTNPTAEDIADNVGTLYTQANSETFDQAVRDESLCAVALRIRRLREIQADAKERAERLCTAWKAIPYLSADVDPERKVNKMENEIGDLHRTADRYAFEVTCTIGFVEGIFFERLVEIDVVNAACKAAADAIAEL